MQSSGTNCFRLPSEAVATTEATTTMEATTTPIRARTARARTHNKARMVNRAKALNRARVVAVKEANKDKVIPNPPRALHPVPTPTPMPPNNLVQLLHLPLHPPRHQAPLPPLVKQAKVKRDRMVTPNRPRKAITQPHPRTNPKATLRAGPLRPPPPPPPPRRAQVPSVASRPPR